MSGSRDYPDRPIVAVGGIVWKGDDVLMIKRGKPPRDNQWTIPGGAQEIGETLEDALIREIREETGVEIEIIDLVAVVDAIFPEDDGRIRHHYTLIDYTCLWVSGEPRPGTEEKAAEWLSPAQLDAIPLWDKTREVIADSRAQVLKVTSQ